MQKERKILGLTSTEIKTYLREYNPKLYSGCDTMILNDMEVVCEDGIVSNDKDVFEFLRLSRLLKEADECMDSQMRMRLLIIRKNEIDLLINRVTDNTTLTKILYKLKGIYHV